MVSSVKSEGGGGAVVSIEKFPTGESDLTPED